MKYYGIIFILVGVLIIIFPDLIAYIFGTFLIFIGINLFFISRIISKNFSGGFSNVNSEGVSFGKYKIFK